MSFVTPQKLAKYGAVCFIPASQFDTVSASMTYAGQAIALLEPSNELPGFLGWFTVAGMNDPSLPATDAGLGSSTDTGIY